MMWILLTIFLVDVVAFSCDHVSYNDADAASGRTIWSDHFETCNVSFAYAAKSINVTLRSILKGSSVKETSKSSSDVARRVHFDGDATEIERRSRALDTYVDWT